MSRFRMVDPGELRLPGGRQDGAEWLKYLDQVNRFGRNFESMTRIQVSEDKAGLLMIQNRVTRATRMHYLSPGDFIKIEVTEVSRRAEYSKLKRVCDVPPPA